MIIIWRIENKFIILSFTIIIIALIGFLDYITGPEFGFSFFYLIPISFLSLYQGIKVWSLLLCSILASMIWFIAEYLVSDYSLLFYPIWNALIRLFIFTAISLLLYYLKENLKRLKLINSNLKKINEEKNKFIGIAAHDLRSPLSGIHSFSQLLLEVHNEKLSTEVIGILDIIYKTSDNSLSILKNLLDISSIESGKVNIKYKKQDYVSFIAYHISLNQILAKKKDILIKMKSKDDILIADFDEHYLGEVIDNLLSNAIKYSNRNSEITVKISSGDNNQILTEIIDHGIGIPEAEQQDLFRYFQTTSSRPTDGEKSTGLGLAISKHIIILHNGTLGFTSVQNKGSNFYYQLPINQSQHASV